MAGGAPEGDTVPNAGVIGWTPLASKPGTSIFEPFVACSVEGIRSPSVVRDGHSWSMFYVSSSGTIASEQSSDGIYDWADSGALAISGGPWSEVSAARNPAGAWKLAAGRSDRSGIDLFDSADGEAWTAAAAFVPAESFEQGEVGGPALLADPVSGEWLLFYDAGGPSPRALGRAEQMGGTFAHDVAPIFDVDSLGAASWNVLSIRSPSAGVDTTRPGGPVYKLWFEASILHHGALGPLDEALGFAGSFDSTAWVPYAGNPILEQASILIPGQPPAYTDVRHPSVVAEPNRYLLYVQQDFSLDGLPARPCVALFTDP